MTPFSLMTPSLSRRRAATAVFGALVTLTLVPGLTQLPALASTAAPHRVAAGEQDDDPANATDCKTASDRGSIVHAAELQVF
jgi:hypothetical protein